MYNLDKNGGNKITMVETNNIARKEWDKSQEQLYVNKRIIRLSMLESILQEQHVLLKILSVTFYLRVVIAREFYDVISWNG